MSPRAARSRKPHQAPRPARLAASVAARQPPLAAAERGWLLAALAITLVARLAYLSLTAPAPVQSDASGFDAAARRQIVTGSYAFPIGRHLWAADAVREDSLAVFYRMPANAWAMPGYTWTLAGVYRVFGTGPGRFVPVRTLQALMSVLTVALCFFIARALLGPSAAWVALALNALYPVNFRVTGYLLTEALFTLLVAVQVVLMVRAARSRSTRDLALLGVATGAAAYVRPVALFVPLCLLALEVQAALRERRLGRELGAMAMRYGLCALAVLALMAPWAVRNQRLYRKFLPTTSAAMLPSLEGELYVRGIYVPETFAPHANLAVAGNDDHVYATTAAAMLRASLPPASAADHLRFQLVRLRMLARALGVPFVFPERSALPVGGIAMQIVILALALLGLWQHRGRGPVVALLGGLALYFVAIHWYVTSLWPRYLYPMMPFVLILAAGSLARGWPRAAAAKPG